MPSFTYPLSGNNPGLAFEGTESGELYYEIREVSGKLYYVKNAAFDGSDWSIQNSSSDARAIVQNKDNSFGHLYQKGTSPAWTTANWLGTPTANEYYVGDYGMSTSDPTGATNNTALLNAITQAANDGGGIVYIPAGQYLIQGTITLNNVMPASFPDVGLIIAGAGGSAELIAAPDGSGNLNDIFSIAGLNSGKGVRFLDVRFSFPVVTTVPTTIPAAIRVSHSQSITAHRCYFHNCLTAVYFDAHALECGSTL